MWWDGEGRVCWAHRELAWASQAPYPLPLPPESPSSGHTSLLAVLHTCPAPLVSRPFHILFPLSAVPFSLSSLASLHWPWAQLRCPYSKMPSLPAVGDASSVFSSFPVSHPPTSTPSPRPAAHQTSLGCTLALCPCSNLAAVDASKRSWELEQSRHKYCSVSGRRAEDTTWVSDSGGGVDGAIL